MLYLYLKSYYYMEINRFKKTVKPLSPYDYIKFLH